MDKIRLNLILLYDAQIEEHNARVEKYGDLYCTTFYMYILDLMKTH